MRGPLKACVNHPDRPVQSPSWVRETCPPLLAADVVLTRSNTLLGRAIRLAERRPGDPARYNHVGLVTRSGFVIGEPTWSGGRLPEPQAEMTEALWHVRRGAVWDFYGPPAGAGRPLVAVYRPDFLDASARSRVAAVVERYVGARYGWWKLLTHLGDSALSAVLPFDDVRLLRRLNFVDSRPICSYLIGLGFEEGADYRFGGKPAGSVDPDDVEDATRSNHGWRRVYEGRIR